MNSTSIGRVRVANVVSSYGSARLYENL